MSVSRQTMSIGGLLVVVAVVLALVISSGAQSTSASPANTVSIDAIAGDNCASIDASNTVNGTTPFVVDVCITWGGTPADNWQGFNVRVQYDDAILAFVPTDDLTLDTIPESWHYTGLGGTAFHSVVTEFDDPPYANTVTDTLFGGTGALRTTSASGAGINATLQCINNGTSPLDLVTMAEVPVQYTITLGAGGVDLPTNVVDASITCEGLPTPEATPTHTATVTPTPTVTDTPTITPTPTETATPTITPTATDTPIFSPTPTLSPTPTPSPPPSEDPDGDGCVTGEEERIGFDPFDPYDFFDVPVPANPDPTPNGPRDKVINLTDVLAVLFYAGSAEDGPPNGNGVDYDSDKDSDGTKDGVAYDRTVGPAPNPPWNAGPPDGVVSIPDVLVVLAQVGLDCADDDGDGMPNGYEDANACLDRSTPDGDADPDGDGASSLLEYTRSTDPCDPDTDDDGMLDGYELEHECLNPFVADANADTDGDGLINLVEFGLSTDPCSVDSDGDGMADGYEVANSCLDPLVADGTADPDIDGLTSLTEFNLGTNPCVNDTDGDGCADGEEPPFGLNPLDFFDFYDVPVPARADPVPNGTKNKVIDITDVLAVVFYAGSFDGGPTNGNGVDYDSDKNGDTVKDGRNYDRSPSPPPNPPWNAGPPNGAVEIGDVLMAVAQAGLDCGVAP